MSTSTEATSANANANDRQVGGTHYKTGSIQHWDIVSDCDVPYLLAVASKYVARHHLKGGREDLEKSVHYQEKWLEKSSANKVAPRSWKVGPANLLDWAAAADLRALELRTLYCMLVWGDVAGSIMQTRELIKARYPQDEFLGHKPGTPEDGGHHARQPVTDGKNGGCGNDGSTSVLQLDDQSDGDEMELRHWSSEDILMGLPERLTRYQYQHRCSEDVQELYTWSGSLTCWLLKVSHPRTTVGG